MLVEINLLPKKETKSTAFFVWIIIIGILAIVLAALFYWQMIAQKEAIETTQKRIDTAEQMAEAKRQKLLSYENSQSVKKLNNAISWAGNQKIDTVYVIQELSKILPDRGFIQELDLEERQQLNLTIQFDTKSEAMYYLNSLLQLNWMEEAILTDSKSTDILENKVSEKIDNDIKVLKQFNIEPRYFAQYEVILNVSALKTAVAEKQKEDENSTSEEGEDSP
ncbi:fimbrial assembly protein [Niallia sp. 03133]|uniref:fimbrial assembly protein n=1 Tax=Niallia sp. 03133 TaxID=3458060 RepID=UPI0040440117